MTKKCWKSIGGVNELPSWERGICSNRETLKVERITVGFKAIHYFNCTQHFPNILYEGMSRVRATKACRDYIKLTENAT